MGSVNRGRGTTKQCGFWNWSMLLTTTACLWGCSVPPSEQQQPVSSSKPATKHRDLFSAGDLGLLESDDRDQWQHIDDILDNLKIADGSTVADIAAGGGWLATRLARRVGPRGVVYAEEIQTSMIEAIVHRLSLENITNVQPVLGTLVDPHLPTGIFDAVLIVNSFSDIETPVPLLEHVREALKSQGLLGVVDFTAGGGGPGPDANERVTADTILSAATKANLRLIAKYPVPPFEFLLVFGK
jgi:ubiquinone/menaquinone biosynthesis C-methylase UbiE